jgi:transposase
MERTCTVAHHLSVEEIDERILSAREGWQARRWMVVRQALVDPQPPAVLATRCGLAPQTVRNLLWAYKQRGPAGVDTPGHGQRQLAYLSLEEERAVLEHFEKESAAGHLSTGRVIKTALEAKVGHRVAKTTAYRLLHRHRWRKVVPRPYHPEGTAEKQEAFKKTSPPRWLRCSKGAIPEIRGLS